MLRQNIIYLKNSFLADFHSKFQKPPVFKRYFVTERNLKFKPISKMAYCYTYAFLKISCRTVIYTHK